MVRSWSSSYRPILQATMMPQITERLAGRRALIFNPLGVGGGKAGRPRSRQGCSTFLCPSGPGGDIPRVCVFFGIWKFAKNKSAAKRCCNMCMSGSRSRSGRRRQGCKYHPRRVCRTLRSGPMWSHRRRDYNYPVRPWHGSKPGLVAYSAPAAIAVHMTTGRRSRRCGRSFTVAGRFRGDRLGHRRGRGVHPLSGRGVQHGLDPATLLSTPGARTCSRRGLPSRSRALFDERDELERQG